MNESVEGGWAWAMAIAAIVLPLLVAWWLVARGAGRDERSKQQPGDNAQPMRDRS